MKKRVKGPSLARLMARGDEQADGVHCGKDTTAAPVVSKATIRIVFILMILSDWYAEQLDICTALLHCQFKGGRKLYMDLSDGFKSLYLVDCVLLFDK